MNDKTHIDELGHSPDALAQRQAELLALIRQTVPEVMSDNQIDEDKLKDLLGQERIADRQEHYELNWAGKAAARREIQKTSSHTLLPDASNPSHAPHMLIEGENLEVLRVLQKSYYGKVKMIYIDPPYNTGNDSFVYPDDYSETLDEYQKRTGEKSAEGYLNKQSLWKKNSKESGQYHSAWLSMMYPRLYLARNLLRDDGVIFISIDDNEAANLKLLCDEVFGFENFIAQIIWRKKSSPDARSTIGAVHDYLLCYVKNSNNPKAAIGKMELSEKRKSSFTNPDNDPRGPWASVDMTGMMGRATKDQYFDIRLPSGRIISPPVGRSWGLVERTFKDLISDNRIWFGAGGDNVPRIKRFLSEVDGQTVPTYWGFDEVGSNEDASNELFDLFGLPGIFDTPKPIKLIDRLIEIGVKSNENQIILDFFSGSATTAIAIIEKNIRDNGNRQVISVQMPEFVDADSEAYKAGYRTIADITRARINKVIAKLKAEHPDETEDLACAHFTLASSNFKVWRGDVTDAQTLRDQLALFQSAEKTAPAQQAADQTAMLAELLLKHGLGALGVHAVSKPRQIAGVTVHRVLMPDDKTMWLCFETYTEALKDEIVKAHPAQVVMLNSCFVGAKADEQLANLQLELDGLDIGLTVI